MEGEETFVFHSDDEMDTDNKVQTVNSPQVSPANSQDYFKMKMSSNGIEIKSSSQPFDSMPQNNNNSNAANRNDVTVQSIDFNKSNTDNSSRGIRPEIQMDEIVLKEDAEHEIGEGTFGKVYRGEVIKFFGKPMHKNGKKK